MKNTGQERVTLVVGTCLSNFQVLNMSMRLHEQKRACLMYRIWVKSPVKERKAYRFYRRWLRMMSLNFPRNEFSIHLCVKKVGVQSMIFLIYMLAEDEYLLVVNAANTEKDYKWLVEHNDFSSDEVVIENVSNHYGLLALQGPKAEEILQTVTDTPLNKMGSFHFETDVRFFTLDQRALVSRTGYTG